MFGAGGGDAPARGAVKIEEGFLDYGTRRSLRERRKNRRVPPLGMTPFSDEEWSEQALLAAGGFDAGSPRNSKTETRNSLSVIGPDRSRDSHKALVIRGPSRRVGTRIKRS